MAAFSLLTPRPTAFAEARLTIDHPQLRNLIVCPQKRGVLTYTHNFNIVEHNLLEPGAPKRTIAELRFEPSSVTALPLGPNDQDTLVAAGGSWNADIHVSYHASPSPVPLWRFDGKLRGTLNNSVLLTRSSTSSAEPRVGITNNDGTFRLYDCAIRRTSITSEDRMEGEDGLQKVGGLRLDTCVNYASLSPSGRTLLTVGDSPNFYLHQLSGSSNVNFQPIATLPIPLPTNTPPNYPTIRPSTFTASFATDFSQDGNKYVIGSQEGVVAVFDLRSSVPMKVFQVDKMRGSIPGIGGATGWISWDPSDWFHMRAPSWSVRSVRFAGGRDGGKEVLAFCEHTSQLHVVDAQTLDTEEVIRVPARLRRVDPPEPAQASTSSLNIHPPSLSQLLPQPLSSQLQLNPTPTAEDDDWETDEDEDGDGEEDEPEASDFPPPPTGLVVPPNPNLVAGLLLSNAEYEYDYREDLDLAGVCFDPTGKWMYVGTTEGVVEWGVGTN